MRIEPITCFRPDPHHVQDFAALPYDVFTNEEARRYVEDHPRTFLAIDRPETGFDEGQNPYAPEVYAHAQQVLRDRQLDQTLVRDEHPCYYLYEQTSGSHRQMGILGSIACDDYLDGTLRRHELTLPAKEADRVRHITTVRAQTGPVFVAYRDNMAINVILDAARAADPIYDFVSDDGVRQRVWRIAREVAVESLGVVFATIGEAYIADGHHRAAAAVRICQDRREQGKQNDPAEYFLAALFPASQLRILPYDRVVSEVGALTEQELIDGLAARGFACGEPSVQAVEPAQKGCFGLFAFGSWRLLRWEGETTEDPVANLDVSVLQNEVLDPLLGIRDPRTDERISFVGGAEVTELESLAGQGGIAVRMYPTSMDEVMSVADAGELMPPKSTWFDPKLLSGLAIRRIW
ncbi:MAG: DUF1015 family protein [Coriobacteriales bacterium]|nr:DUF1015 family protein [Coriobacteriales bacterium]